MRIKKIYLFVLTGIIIFLLFISTGIYYYFNFIKNYQQKEVISPISNQSLQISARMKNTWSVMGVAELLKYQRKESAAGYRLSGSEDTYFTVVTEDAKGKYNFIIDESIKVLDNKLPDSTVEFKKIKSGKIRLKNIGIDALMYEFSNVSSGVKNIVTGEQVESKPYIIKKIIFLKSEKMYYFDFAARAQDYSRDVKEFDKIISSLLVS